MDDIRIIQAGAVVVLTILKENNIRFTQESFTGIGRMMSTFNVN